MESIEDLAGKLASGIEKKRRGDTSRKPITDSSDTDTVAVGEAQAIRPQVDGVGDPQCLLCRGLGYISLDVPVGHPHFGKLFPCTCRMAELQMRRDESLRSLGNLEALKRFTFDTFCPDGQGLSAERQRNLHAAYQEAVSYARRLEGWLLLIGGYGCGKTHLAAAIANDVLSRGIVPLFVTVPDLLDHLRGAFVPEAAQSYTDRFEQVRTAPLLVLDDLGTENATPWALEKLFQLLNYRHMAALPTVITTNQELERIDPRLRSRLADHAVVEIVTILAPDFRLGGVDRGSSPLNTLPYYSDMTLDTFDLRRGELTKEEVQILANAVGLARSYAAAPEGWLVFYGANGVGKTHLAAAIANERDRLGQPAVLVVVPDLLDYFRAAYNPQSSMSLDRRFDEVRRAPLLVLDDLGTESATPWAKEKLFQLVNHRYVAKLPTVVTTVMSSRDLDPKIAIRFADMSRSTQYEIKVPPYLGGAHGSRKSPPSTRAVKGTGTRSKQAGGKPLA